MGTDELVASGIFSPRHVLSAVCPSRRTHVEGLYNIDLIRFIFKKRKTGFLQQLVSCTIPCNLPSVNQLTRRGEGNPSTDEPNTATVTRPSAAGESCWGTEKAREGAGS